MSVPELEASVVLTVTQAAEEAQVSPWTIRREINEGRLRAKRIGSCVRITRSAFEAWLDSES